jgi:micrococcal nuclease
MITDYRPRSTRCPTLGIRRSGRRADPEKAAAVLAPWPATKQVASGTCHSSHPDFCIPPPPPDLNCTSPALQGRTNFTVLPPDPHRFDADQDGVGCERRR